MKTNRHRARFNKALSDAAMSFLLGQKKKKKTKQMNMDQKLFRLEDMKNHHRLVITVVI